MSELTCLGARAPDRCRQRAYRRRLAEAARARGLPATVTLRDLERGADPQGRNGDAQAAAERRKRRPRQGVTVYFATVADADRLAQHLSNLRDERLQAACVAITKSLTRRRMRKAAP